MSDMYVTLLLIVFFFSFFFLNQKPLFKMNTPSSIAYYINIKKNKWLIIVHSNTLNIHEPK